jgi:hypothetical protein
MLRVEVVPIARHDNRQAINHEALANGYAHWKPEL